MGGGSNVRGSDLLSSPTVLGKCRACDITKICCLFEFSIIKSGAMTLSRSPQCRAFSRAMMDESRCHRYSPWWGGGQWLQMPGALSREK